jgi:hypothetical protein
MAQQGFTADRLQRMLLRRFRFQRRLKPSVRLLTLHGVHCLKNVA